MRQTVISFHDEDFLSQTADTGVHLRLSSIGKETETLVRTFRLWSLQWAEKGYFARQSQQAANDQNIWQGNHGNRRVKQKS